MLPANPLLASLVIIGWLVFKPSVWQCYIKTIDPQLSPDFALIDLRSSHWQQPTLQRLLFLGHGLWPLIVSIFVTLITWSGFDVKFDTLLLTGCYALCFSMICGLLSSLIVSVAFGLVMGLIGGMLLSIPVGMAGEIIFSMTENIAVIVISLLKYTEASALSIAQPAYASLTVILGIFSAGLASSIMSSTTTPTHFYPPHRQIGSVVIGVLVSAVVTVLIILLAGLLALGVSKLFGETESIYTLAIDGLTAGLFGFSASLIWFWYIRHSKQALLIGLSITLLFELLTFLKNSAVFPPLQIFLTGMHGSVENAFLFSLLFLFPYILARHIANAWSGVIAGIFGSAGVYITFRILTAQYTPSLDLLFAGVVFILGLSVNWWRPLLFYPFTAAWNLLLQHADEKRQASHLLYWHSAFWDEHQYIRLFGLENYLVTITECNPALGQVAIEYLSNSRQSWAAQAAQIELDARKLQSYQSVEAISRAHHQLAAGELISPVSALLRSFSRISRDVEAALAQESHYNQRLALDNIEERLDGLLRELTRSSEIYALRFRPIAATWRQTIAAYTYALSAAVESRQEINNPYVIGIPLTEHQEIFVGRSDVSEHIERLLLDYRCPPLLLYGQRRTGKTSLLNNLGKLLPTTIIPLFIDLQGPTSLAKNHEGFLYNIGRAMLTSAKRHREMILPTLTREKLQIDPFTSFDEWLDELEQALDAQQTMLLALDEFSTLEFAFNKGLLDKDAVLGMFRHIIQHRPRLKVLLSGSHTIDEFEQWASYLINVQTVHISYLQPKAALQLIQQPVKDFALRYEVDAQQHILEITHCHPALIQLMCSEIVTLKNKQPIAERRLAQLADVEAAIPGALQHGRFFFADIANNQVTKTGLSILRFLAEQGEGAFVAESVLHSDFPEEFDLNINRLIQRELIESVDNGYRFQIELIRRSFIT